MPRTTSPRRLHQRPLWSLTFGNDDGAAGAANTLSFRAGIKNETDGLFGTLTPVDGLDGDEE